MVDVTDLNKFPVPSGKFPVAKRNSEDLDQLINGPDAFVQNRAGKHLRTWQKIMGDLLTVNFTGDWVTATNYNENDAWRNTVDGVVYVVIADYTSGASEAADIALSPAVVAVYQTRSGDIVEYDTLADAVATVAADIPVNGFCRTIEYSAGNGGGNEYQLLDAGSPGARPVDDGGSVIHVAGGSGGIYLLGIFLNGVVFMSQFGPAGDGVQDDTIPVQSAVSYAEELVFQAGNRYRVTSSILCDHPIKIYGNRSEIVPDLPATGGRVFRFESSYVRVECLGFDGSGISKTLTGTMYLIFGGDGITKYKKHEYIDISATDNTSSDGLTGSSNSIVTHGIYVDNVDDVSISNCQCEELSGAFIFLRDIKKLAVSHNNILNSIWYPVHLVGGISDFEIHHNTISCTAASGVYYGGGIDLMSQHIPLEARNRNGAVYNNTLSGAFSYGAVIRILSTEHLSVFGNRIDSPTEGGWSIAASLTGIRVDTRGTLVGDGNGPCRDIDIYANTLIAGSNPSGDWISNGVYISNQFQTERNPCRSITVRDNYILSLSSTEYWDSGVIAHGFDGGLEGVRVIDNDISSKITSGVIVNGVVGAVANNSQGRVTDLRIGGNAISDLGSADASYQSGIGVGSNVESVFNTTPNTIENLFYGVRTFPGAGPTIERLDDQAFLSITSAEVLQGAPISMYARPLSGEAPYDPPSLGSGDSTFIDISVPDAAIGDFASASFSLDQQLVSISAYVRTAGSVRATLTNTGGGTVDLGLGTIYANVLRRGS